MSEVALIRSEFKKHFDWRDTKGSRFIDNEQRGVWWEDGVATSPIGERGEERERESQ